MAPKPEMINYGTNDPDVLEKNPPLSKPPNGMAKTESSFSLDLQNFAEGTVPQSIIVAVTIGKLNLN